jgi:hypothetical protein
MSSYSELQAQRRARGGASEVASSTAARLTAAQNQADSIAEEASSTHPGGTAVPPNGGSAVAPNLVSGGARGSETGALDPVQIPPPAPAAPKRRPVLRQGTTFLLDDFEKLTDIVHALGRKHQVKNPLGAKLGPSHVAGALVHHLLPMWEENPEALAAIVRGFLNEWAGATESDAQHSS